jgi:cleavage and polyadenylation specificity factor subunit 1
MPILFFILLGVFFLRWLEQQKTLALLGKDFNPIEVLSVEFLLHDYSLSFVNSDDHGNLQMLCYSPQDMESRGGEMLLAKAQFHLGQRASQIIRIPIMKEMNVLAYHMLLFGTTSGTYSPTSFRLIDMFPVGGIGALSPISEQVFRRLTMISHKMQTLIPHFAGLNPKAFRKFDANYRFPSRQRRENNLIDGRLVSEYLNLEVSVQQQIARQIGMKREQVIQTIHVAHLTSNVL